MADIDETWDSSPSGPFVGRLYLPQFEDAIFISYTHFDNVPFGPDEQRWITHLHEQLDRRVQQLLGEPLKVWRDEKLDGNDVFTETILERLSNVAVLITICSPRYVRSEWCQRELDAFVRAAVVNGGVQVGTKSRLFKVLKTPVPQEELPESLVPLLGYEFYEYLTDEQHVREFLLNPDPEQRWKFYAKVDDLAQDITCLLREMVGLGARPSAAPAGGYTVYVAEVASDMAHHRDSLRRELECRGHEVLPDHRLPLTIEELTATVDDALSQSRLSVHLLGSRYGARPEGDNRSVCHIQLDLARRHATGGGAFHQLIWLDDQPDSTVEAQAVLIDELESAENGPQVEVIRSEPDAFKAHVQSTLTRVVHQPDPTVQAQGDEIRVYIVHERDDRPSVAALQTELEAHGHVVMLPLSHGSETEIREVHETAMVLCDAVIIVYGTATEHWVRLKLFDLVKARGWGRTVPFKAKAVWLAEPDTDPKRLYTTTEAQVLDGRQGSERSVLEPFLSRLRSTAHAP